MKYFTELNINKYFYKEPKKVTKETLDYAIGSLLYMPATMENLKDKLGNYKTNSARSICFDLEDALEDEMVQQGIDNIDLQLTSLTNSDEFLFFVRVRDVDQIKKILELKNADKLTGINLPKANFETIKQSIELLKNTNLYLMPILEDIDLIHKYQELYRDKNLNNIYDICKENQDMILNIRVGATDFSSCYGVRKSNKHTIYDLEVVKEIIIEIKNRFGLYSDFTVSGCVFEYFSEDFDSVEMQTLLKEVNLDILNGFMGKTTINPKQSLAINLSYVVSYEEYLDAKNILDKSSGVFSGGNKMNEVKPHTSWAKNIMKRSEVYGVLSEYISKEDFLERILK